MTQIQHQGHEEVHGRPGDGHREPPPVGLLAVGAGLVLGVHLLEVAHPDDLHVGPGGDGLEAVLRLALPERPQAGAEAEEVLGDLHACPLGGQEVTELVQHDHDDHGADHG